MNEDELIASQKIMGDVDSQEEKQSDGSPDDTRTGEKDEQERGEGALQRSAKISNPLPAKIPPMQTP